MSKSSIITSVITSKQQDTSPQYHTYSISLRGETKCFTVGVSGVEYRKSAVREYHSDALGHCPQKTCQI